MAWRRGPGLIQRFPMARIRAIALANPAPITASIKLWLLSSNSSPKDSLRSWSRLFTSQNSGNPTLINGGRVQMLWASKARQPLTCQRSLGSVGPPISQRRLLRRCHCSAATRTATTARAVRARATAPGGSSCPCQRSSKPVESVGTARSSTAPYSLTTSIPAKAMPAVTAGMASGRLTRKKLIQAPRPRLREASS